MGDITAIAGIPIAEVIQRIEINFWTTWYNFGRGPGCLLHDDGDILWFETPIPIVPYNTVMKFQARENVDEKIDSIVRLFFDRNVTQLWIVHPSSSPADLAERLSKRGLQEVEVAPCMARDLVDLPASPPRPAGVEIRKVMTASDLLQVHELAAWRWGVPEEFHTQLREIINLYDVGKPDSKTHFWLAWKDGSPIAKLGMHCSDDTAGIYGVVTKPEARGLGLASILMVEAMKFAKADGYKLAVLNSSPLAEELYKRLGFITVTSFRLFASASVYL